MLNYKKNKGWFKFSTRQSVHVKKSQAVYSTTSGKVSTTINPWFVTGFSDGEGCFHLAVNKHKRFKQGYSLGAVFKIHLHNKDLALLEKLKTYFGVGKIYELKRGTVQFQVSSIEDLKVIISHFDKYPLITSK